MTVDVSANQRLRKDKHNNSQTPSAMGNSSPHIIILTYGRRQFQHQFQGKEKLLPFSPPPHKCHLLVEAVVLKEPGCIHKQKKPENYTSFSSSFSACEGLDVSWSVC